METSHGLSLLDIYDQELGFIEDLTLFSVRHEELMLISPMKGPMEKIYE